MKNKVIMTRGLPGSGKTFWATNFVTENPNTTIVCKDDIRFSMGATYGENGKRVKESKVVEKRNELIQEALEKGRNVIVADTNLNHLHIKNVKALVFPKYRETYDFEVKDFTNVPVEVCIERCASRPEGKEFWKGVIMRMKNEFLPPRKLYTHPEYYLDSKPKCVIFDLDGTLALMPEVDGVRVGRGPFEETRAHEDLPNVPVVEIAKMYASREDVTVICLSGRKEDLGREATENWLNAHGIDYDHLFMRKAGDSRNDAIIKRELYEEHIKDKYLIHAVFDDRKRVLEQLWIPEGLPLFAVGNPYHDF